jgi:NAD(P)-dependent dehydrogenase (short-subunit alcohol dehydrogenase family)
LRDNNNSAVLRLQPDCSGTHGELSTPTKVGQMTTPSASERIAVVTGASAGIGEATARTLAGQGFHVVCVARREAPIKALADEIGGTAIVADVTSDEHVTALAGALDRVDVLVNSARQPGHDRDPAARPGQLVALQPEAEQIAANRQVDR